MLNNCQTPMGKRKFQYNFLNPVFDEKYLQREYDITEYYLNNFDNYDNAFKIKLSSIKDLSKIQRQVFLKKISPKTFYSFYNNIITIKEIFKIINNDKELINYFNVYEKNISNISDYCDNITNFINKHINIVLSKDIEQTYNFETNFINYGVDNELDQKTETLLESETKLEEIRSYLSSLIENKEKKNGKTNDYVKIHETDKNNYSLVSTTRRCKLLADALPKDNKIVSLTFIVKNKTKIFDFKYSKTQFNYEKQSASNNYIVDEQISSLCKNISTIKVSMKDQITLVYNKFIEQFETYQSQIETIINFITLLDVLHTKSELAKKYNYCKPNIVNSDKSFVDTKKLRHCLIEQFQNNELYVTNDIVIGDGKTDGILLYGTNAVGKTSLIKALGISIIMAQAGLYVPCSEFNFKPYKYIFTRIIGNDNIFKGLSTFAVEMSELRTILRLTNENSLILGDELCSGTEILSAISIFVAGIQQLQKCKSSFIFATHLHEIVDYEEITSLTTVKLKHMEVIYDKQKDLLIYDRKLRDGPGNNMYGLEVCKSLNLPQDFLDAAYEIRMKYHSDTGSILSLKTSSYNSKKIVGTCENCHKNQAKEVHHLQFQKNADDNGIISTSDTVFHKNNLANLMSLCEKCHNDLHQSSNKGSKRVKTTKGIKIQDV